MKNSKKLYKKAKEDKAAVYMDHIKELASHYPVFPNPPKLLEILDRLSREYVAQRRLPHFYKALDEEISEFYEDFFRQWRDY